MLPLSLGTELHQMLQPGQAAGRGREGSRAHDDHVPLIGAAAAAAAVLATGRQVRRGERHFPAERRPRGWLRGTGCCIGGYPWRQIVDRLRWWWIA